MQYNNGKHQYPTFPISRSPRQKINRETLDLISILYQVDPNNTKHSTHPKTKEFIFLSSHGIFPSIHMLRHKISLTKFKVEITSSILSVHDDMKLEITIKRNFRKIAKRWKLTMLLNSQWRKWKRNFKGFEMGLGKIV